MATFDEPRLEQRPNITQTFLRPGVEHIQGSSVNESRTVSFTKTESPATEKITFESSLVCNPNAALAVTFDSVPVRPRFSIHSTESVTKTESPMTEEIQLQKSLDCNPNAALAVSFDSVPVRPRCSSHSTESVTKAESTVTEEIQLQKSLVCNTNEAMDVNFDSVPVSPRCSSHSTECDAILDEDRNLSVEQPANSLIVNPLDSENESLTSSSVVSGSVASLFYSQSALLQQDPSSGPPFWKDLENTESNRGLISTDHPLSLLSGVIKRLSSNSLLQSQITDILSKSLDNSDDTNFDIQSENRTSLCRENEQHATTHMQSEVSPGVLLVKCLEPHAITASKNEKSSYGNNNLASNLTATDALSMSEGDVPSTSVLGTDQSKELLKVFESYSNFVSFLSKISPNCFKLPKTVLEDLEARIDSFEGVLPEQRVFFVDDADSCANDKDLAFGKLSEESGYDSTHGYTPKKSHQPKQLYPCRLCSQVFKKPLQLELHIRGHNGDLPFQCGECNREFTFKRDLMTHLRYHSGGRPFECEECGKKFARQANLKIHERTHTGEKPYICKECGKGFAQQGNWKIHVVSVHTDRKSYICHLCGKAFGDPRTLSTHVKIHSGEKPFKCDECGKCFSQKCNLKTHMVTHTGERPYICVECGESFTQMSNLKTHKNLHTGRKPYMCPHCGRCFAQQSNLKIHMRIHSGEKPHRCEECGKTFTQQGNLRTHMKIHKGEKRHMCSYCGKSFIQLSNLKTHYVVHTGEKPYKCEICGTNFSQSSNLKSHVKLHKGIKRRAPIAHTGKFYSLGQLDTDSLIMQDFAQVPSQMNKADILNEAGSTEMHIEVQESDITVSYSGHDSFIPKDLSQATSETPGCSEW